MARFGSLTFLLTLASALPAPVPNVNNVVRDYPTTSSNRAQGVIDAFRVSWDGYHKYAFPHDELHPVSNTYSDSRYADT